MTQKELQLIHDLAEAYVKTLPDETVPEIVIKAQFYQVVDKFYNYVVETNLKTKKKKNEK